MKFRYDINGLRALSLIGVVFFHFGFLFPGGFSGVDVFFVISGYLMSNIIISSIKENKFNFIKFFVSRINRIFPALIFLCAIVLVIAWFILWSHDFQNLSKHTFSSLNFISNLIYFRESGYFDISSKSKWLLHTWSLSVEWQFYILFPIVLFLFVKFVGGKSLPYFILFSFFISFFYSCYLSIYNPDFSYYSLSSRAWEMLFGAIAYFYPLDRFNNLNQKFISRLGFVLIVLSFLFLNENLLWPSGWTIIPTLGAYFIIATKDHQCKFIENVIVRKLGVWSYSIYLWHWPIAVLGSYYTITNWPVFGIGLSVLFGFVSYKYVETKQSFKLVDLTKKGWNKLSLFSVLYFALVFFSFYSYYNNGFSNVESIEYRTEKKLTDDFFVLGDSHGIHLIHGLESLTLGRVVNYSHSGCLPLKNIDRFDSRVKPRTCSTFINGKIEKIINEDPVGYLLLSSMGPVYLTGTTFNGKDPARVEGLGVELITDANLNDKWAVYETGLRQTLDELSQLENINVIYIFDIPELGIDYGCMNRNKTMNLLSFRIPDPLIEQPIQSCMVPMEDVEKRNDKFKRFVWNILNDYPSVGVYDPTSHFCDKDVCRGYNKLSGFLYKDADHLTISGSNYWADGFYDWFVKLTHNKREKE